MQKLLSSLARQEKSLAVMCCILNIKGQVDCREGGGKVGKNTGQTDVEGLTRDFFQGKGILDGVLGCLLALGAKPPPLDITVDSQNHLESPPSYQHLAHDRPAQARC